MEREREYDVDVPKWIYEQIADQINDGLTSGLIEDGEGLHVSWEFKAEAWQD